jgi:hypothetical protein
MGSPHEAVGFLKAPDTAILAQELSFAESCNSKEHGQLARGHAPR